MEKKNLRHNPQDLGQTAWSSFVEQTNDWNVVFVHVCDLSTHDASKQSRINQEK